MESIRLSHFTILGVLIVGFQGKSIGWNDQTFVDTGYLTWNGEYMKSSEDLDAWGSSGAEPRSEEKGPLKGESFKSDDGMTYRRSYKNGDITEEALYFPRSNGKFELIKRRHGKCSVSTVNKSGRLVLHDLKKGHLKKTEGQFQDWKWEFNYYNSEIKYWEYRVQLSKGKLIPVTYYFDEVAYDLGYNDWNYDKYTFKYQENVPAEALDNALKLRKECKAYNS